MDKVRCEQWLNFLREEGYAPKTDSDGDIVFKVEGLTYVIFLEEADAVFFRMVLPNIYKAADDARRRQAIQAADEATAATKVAKVFHTQNGVFWASVEMFATPESVFPQFARCLSAMRSALARFTQQLGADAG